MDKAPITFCILVVDDNEKNLELVVKMLKRQENYHLKTATSGQEALDTVANGGIDLILLDIAMPQLDGFEVCRRLKQDEQSQNIPIIFLSAATDQKSIAKGFSLGAVDYVTKPFHLPELKARVKTHLSLNYTMEALIKANHAKSRFFSMVGGDLLDTFNQLAEMSDVLTDNIHELEQGQIVEHGLRLSESIGQGHELVVNLLEWTKAEMNRIRVFASLINFNELAQDVWELFESSAMDKGITYELKLSPKSEVMADYDLIYTAYKNLISNAVKFTGANGTITISDQFGQGRLAITVADTGIGMNKKVLDGLFSLDGVAPILGTAGEKGFGLGLLLAKKFIEKCDGRLEVTSEPGKGSRFTLSLPLA